MGCLQNHRAGQDRTGHEGLSAGATAPPGAKQRQHISPNSSTVFAIKIKDRIDQFFCKKHKNYSISWGGKKASACFETTTIKMLFDDKLRPE